MTRPLRLALFGGGPGSFIGSVHRMAAQLDGRFILTAGAFSRDPERSLSQGRLWGVADDRVHTSHESLFAAEVQRADGIEAVAIATPNDSHHAIAKAAVACGLPVICDKPMTATLEEAHDLAFEVRSTAQVFALTFTYTGYPMIRAAREMVAKGLIGSIRKVMVDYPQGWLARNVEENNRQAAWRTDPARAGLGGCIGDIGVHAFQLAEYVSGVQVESLCADLSRTLPGRLLDDDCNILLRFAGGASGILTASQIMTGEANDLTVRVYGEHGGIRWQHSRAGELALLHLDGRTEILHSGTAMAGPAAASITRLPAGHPEGFIEAFANLYGNFADAIAGVPGIADATLPGISDGVRSIAFIYAATVSHAERAWQRLENEGR